MPEKMRTIVISSSVGCLLGTGILLVGLRLASPTHDDSLLEISAPPIGEPNTYPQPAYPRNGMPDQDFSRHLAETVTRNQREDGSGGPSKSQASKQGEVLNDEALSPEEEDARADFLAYKEIEKSLDEFDSEELDVEWSKSVSVKIERDIALALEDPLVSGTLESVRCKSQRCIATVMWPSISEARRQHVMVATQKMSENCIVSSFIPASAEETDAGYEHKIFLNCRPEEA